MGDELTSGSRQESNRGIMAEISTDLRSVIPVRTELDADEMTVGDKCRKLIEGIGLDVSAYQIVDHGPFALVRWENDSKTNRFLIIHDGAGDQDIDSLEQKFQGLEHQDKYLWSIFSPTQFLAWISTNGVYAGFHDKMSSPIITSKIRLVDGKPDYESISKLLEDSGFKNPGKGNLKGKQ